MGFGEIVVATGSCDRSCQYAIAPDTFLREVPLTLSASGSAWSWQMLICLLRIPLRTATPITASCDRLRPLHASQSPHLRSRLELARTGGISSDSRVARIEQPPRIVVVVFPVLGFTILVEVGFVVLSSVGAHPRAKRMAPTDDRTTKPDHLYLVSPLDM